MQTTKRNVVLALSLGCTQCGQSAPIAQTPTHAKEIDRQPSQPDERGGDPNGPQVSRTTTLSADQSTTSLAGGNRTQEESAEPKSASSTTSTDSMRRAASTSRRDDETRLEAIPGSCKKRGCPPTNPCCNSCSFVGWVVADENVKVVGADLPTPKLNTCGAAFDLFAVGKRENGHFTVQAWRKVDARRAARVEDTERK